MIFLFWILLFIILYSYLFYPVVIYLAGIIAGKNKNNELVTNSAEKPSVTLLVTAFNEIEMVERKIKNSKALKYPHHKLTLLWVTDGSNDGTPEKVKLFNDVKLLHHNARNGKIHAMNRAAQTVKSDIIVFCDANTFLTPDTLLNIAKHFENPRVGCVAGEKQIIKDGNSAAGAGEGLYWKYESWIKQLDYKFNTTLGAAGELFAVRRELYEPVEGDTILDDFIISLRIAANGYTVAYEPYAIAREYPSYSIAEEMKRKIRIAAGGFQALTRLPYLLNPLRYPRLAFQFISHKVFRWVICPFAMLLLIPVHAAIVMMYPAETLFIVLAGIHILVYLMALAGRMFEQKNIKMSWIFLPYYFVSTNFAQLQGLARYLKKTQSVNWERARRAN